MGWLVVGCALAAQPTERIVILNAVKLPSPAFAGRQGSIPILACAESARRKSRWIFRWAQDDSVGWSSLLRSAEDCTEAMGGSTWRALSS